MRESAAISTCVLNKTFPFYFKVSSELRIMEAGNSLLKIKSDIVREKLLNAFEVLRPGATEITFKSLLKSEDKVFLLRFKHLEQKIMYKAELIVLAADNMVVFVGSPFLQEIDELSSLNLTLNDFAISDPTVDMLQILQVNKMVNDDMKELNRRLKIKEEKYRGLVEEAKEIIFTTDIDGNFTYMNEIGMNEIGLDEDHLLDTNFADLMEDHYVDLIMLNGHDLLEGKKDLAYVEFPLKSFDNLWIGQNMTLTKLDSGQLGFQGVARNITEKIEYEKIILGEKEKALSAAKEKSRFLANMSHEIRTPLNGIMGLTTLLLDTEITEKQKRYLSAITSSSETLMVVINDILDISKIDAGKLNILEQPFRIKTCIAQLVEMLSVKAIEKGIHLAYEEPKNIPDILLGDEPRLNQILYNIVGNAIKFTQKGSVKIKVSAENIDLNRLMLKIDVKDSGIGISEDKIDHIFKAFGQIDDNDSREFQGTGLGLTIAAKLVALHQGVINVTSTVGKGSVFSIQLPYQIFKEGSNKLPPANSIANNDYKVLSNLNVLLAEDNPVNQMVARDLLAKKGVKVDLAENGKIAIEKILVKKYDVVLMDMQMPTLDGYSAMKQIRQDLGFHDLMIIALTAYVSEQEEAKCLSYGANAYLSKPFKPFELYNKIYNVLGYEEKKGEESYLPTSSSLLPKITEKNESICDFSRLYESADNDKAIIHSTLHVLSEVIPIDIQELKDCIQRKDFKKTGEIIHRAAPNFKLIFSPDYADFLSSLESLSKEAANHELIENTIIKLKHQEKEILQSIKQESKNHL